MWSPKKIPQFSLAKKLKKSILKRALYTCGLLEKIPVVRLAKKTQKKSLVYMCFFVKNDK